jgi:hypothetical protein
MSHQHPATSLFLNIAFMLVQIAIAKYHRLKDLWISEIYFSQSGNYKSETRVPAWRSTDEGLLQVVDLNLLLSPHMTKRKELAFWHLLIWAQILLLGAPPLCYNYLSKAPSPNTITKRIPFQHLNLVASSWAFDHTTVAGETLSHHNPHSHWKCGVLRQVLLLV